ncbi:MAG TPA: hypothetical protein VHL58_10620 [Thermoanaerobaculia bacterium]|nr:hypothetical protein [Thermoanaerobaculia bacterium]
MFKFPAPLCIAAMLLSAATAFAHDPEETAGLVRRAANLQRSLVTSAKLAPPPCSGIAITLPVTIYGEMTPSTCQNELGLRDDVFTISPRRGQTLTVDYSSTAFEVLLFMLIRQDVSGPDVSVSWLSSGVSRETMTYTIEETRTYRLQAETLWDVPSGRQPTLGPYVMKIGLSDSTACTAPTLLANPAMSTARLGERAILNTAFMATDPVDIKWYASANDTTPIGEGVPFSTPALTQSTTFWLRLSNACGSSDAIPFSIFVSDARRHAARR